MLRPAAPRGVRALGAAHARRRRACRHALHRELVRPHAALVAQHSQRALRLVKDRNLRREAGKEAQTRLAVVACAEGAKLHVRHEGGPPLVILRFPVQCSAVRAARVARRSATWTHQSGAVIDCLHELRSASRSSCSRKWRSVLHSCRPCAAVCQQDAGCREHTAGQEHQVSRTVTSASAASACAAANARHSSRPVGGVSLLAVAQKSRVALKLLTHTPRVACGRCSGLRTHLPASFFVQAEWYRSAFVWSCSALSATATPSNACAREPSVQLARPACTGTKRSSERSPRSSRPAAPRLGCLLKRAPGRRLRAARRCGEQAPATGLAESCRRALAQAQAPP